MFLSLRVKDINYYWFPHFFHPFPVRKLVIHELVRAWFQDSPPANVTIILLHYYRNKLLLYYICMFTYRQSFQQTSTLNIFKSQFILWNNWEEQRKDLSHNKLHSNYKYYQAVKGAIFRHLLFTYRAKTCSASLNSKNIGTVQLFNTMFRHWNYFNAMDGFGLKLKNS